MLYERKIRYLDYYEGGMRVKGGGFAKLEVRDGNLRLELAVTGLHHTDTFVREVMLCGRGREKSAGRIEIIAGKGQFRQLWRDLENIGDTGISYGELTGIRIPLGAGRELSGKWQEAGAQAKVRPGRGKEDGAPPESLGEESGEEKVLEERALTEASERQEWIEERESIRGGMGDSYAGGQSDPRDKTERGPESGDANGPTDSTKGVEENMESGPAMRQPEAGSYAAIQTDRNEQAEAERVRGTFAAGREDRGRIINDKGAGKEYAQMSFRGMDIAQASLDREKPGRGSVEWKEADAQPSRHERAAEQERGSVRLMEDKWPQLWAIYPHIRPFQDEREYLSIGPSDFVLFPESSYRAVNNSFLLHGYYNYRHLILGRMERKGESCYYIGVPGNFYEREKQVAIMFGFESFECAEEPAQAGDFGYYMMRTEI